MTDYLEVGPTPSGEDCQQVGTPQYDAAMARRECQQFITAIRRVCGEEPAGATLTIRSNPHDFGTYPEVAVRFNDNVETAVAYAYHVEANAPEYWSDEDRLALAAYQEAQTLLRVRAEIEGRL